MKTKVFQFDVTPVAAVRQVRSDAWKKRPAVLRYRAFRDALRLEATRLGFEMPASGYHLTFLLPMPNSWSDKKKRALCGQPHQQRPDKDNLEKAFLDALCESDCHVWDGRVTKAWWIKGAIQIKVTVNE